jgi:hypothetical protein
MGQGEKLFSYLILHCVIIWMDYGYIGMHGTMTFAAQRELAFAWLEK